jgi:hypothetical protein
MQCTPKRVREPISSPHTGGPVQRGTGGVERLRHPLRGALRFFVSPVVFATLRPPANLCQPSGLGNFAVLISVARAPTWSPVDFQPLTSPRHWQRSAGMAKWPARSRRLSGSRRTPTFPLRKCARDDSFAMSSPPKITPAQSKNRFSADTSWADARVPRDNSRRWRAP